MNHQDINEVEGRLLPPPLSSGKKTTKKFGKSFKHFDNLISNLPNEVRLPGVPSGDIGCSLGSNGTGRLNVNIYSCSRSKYHLIFLALTPSIACNLF